MATANQTYGVNAAMLEAYVAQLAIGTSDVALDDVKTPVLISAAAAQLNGILLPLVGSAGIASLAADVNSIGYLNAQRAVCFLALPDVLMAYFDLEQVSSGVQVFEARAKSMIDLLLQDPRFIGVEGGSKSPRASTTVRLTGLDTSDAARRKRSRFRRDDRSPKRDHRW